MKDFIERVEFEEQIALLSKTIREFEERDRDRAKQVAVSSARQRVLMHELVESWSLCHVFFSSQQRELAAMEARAGVTVGSISDGVAISAGEVSALKAVGRHFVPQSGDGGPCFNRDGLPF